MSQRVGTHCTVDVRRPDPGRPALCVVGGEIDLSTVAELRAGLEEAFASSPAVVADLSGVTFLASTGVRALVDACLGGSPGTRVLSLVTGPRVETVLRICVVSAVASCHPDRAAATHACLAMLRASRTD
ncbi:MAG: STAS domain-containing protein [Pseudonocardiales bacterium]|nr:STAS domain-containing protein [Pseudonocardiales bacterium]